MKEPIKLTHAQIIGIQRYLNVFNTDDGRWVLEHLKSLFCDDTYERGDSYHTAFRCGQRSVILEIETTLDRGKQEIIEEEEKEE
ncbi:MAG TPA: hypothetical protein VJ343_02795 [archaeon]|nr:hypothetical protein [archaeon]